MSAANMLLIMVASTVFPLFVGPAWLMFSIPAGLLTVWIGHMHVKAYDTAPKVGGASAFWYAVMWTSATFAVFSFFGLDHATGPKSLPIHFFASVAVIAFIFRVELSKRGWAHLIPQDKDFNEFMYHPASYLNYTDQELGFRWTPAQKIRESMSAGALVIDRFRFFPEVRGIYSKFLNLETPHGQNEFKRMTKDAEGVEIRFEPLSFTKTILAVGGMGSGKTEYFNAILSQNKGFEHFRRTVIHDVKGDFVEKFYDPATDYIFNPYDGRGFSWDIWADMNEYEGLITSFIRNLIESSIKEPDFFSSSAARVLNEYFLQSHFENIGAVASVKWDMFFDLVEKYEAQGEDDKTKASIYATMELAIEHFKFMRWLSGTAAPTFTIREFLAGSGNLYLLNNAAYSKKLNPLFTGFVALLIEVLLSRSDTKEDLTLLLLDEYLSLKFDDDTRLKLLTQIRSKGGCLVIGTQYIPKDDKKAQQLLDSSKYAMVLFRINDNETVKHIVDTFGKTQYLSTRQSHTKSSGNRSVTTTQDVQERSFITTDMIQSMPPYHHITFIPESKTVYLGYTDLADLDKGNGNFVKRDLAGFYRSCYTKAPEAAPEVDADRAIDGDGIEYSISATAAAMEKYEPEQLRDMYFEFVACEDVADLDELTKHYALEEVSLEKLFEEVAE